MDNQSRPFILLTTRVRVALFAIGLFLATALAGVSVFREHVRDGLTLTWAGPFIWLLVPVTWAWWVLTGDQGDMPDALRTASAYVVLGYVPMLMMFRLLDGCLR